MTCRPVPTGCRRGGITPLAVLCLSLLLAVIAVVVDGGMLLEDRRHVQAAADAAALAAAADLFSNYNTNQGIDPGGTAKASALTTAAANGFDNDGSQSIVTVNLSPQSYQSGPNVCKSLPPSYVEVIIQYNAARLFSNVFGSGSIPVRGRAAACGQLSTSADGIICLGMTASPAFTSGSSGPTNIVGAAMRINSNAADALSITNSGSVFASQYHFTTGAGIVDSGTGKLLGYNGIAPTKDYGSTIPDPLRYLPDPDPTKLTLRSSGNLTLTGGGNVDLYPGIYAGSVKIGGSTTVTLHANSDGTPGIYYLEAGITVTNNASLLSLSSEAGVLLYNYWTPTQQGQIHLAGGGNIQLYPPVSGPYKGLAIFQTRGSSSTSGPQLIVSGSGTMQVYGTVYAAYANARVSGLGVADVIGGQWVVDTMTVLGNGQLNVNRSSYPIAATRTIRLVE